MAEGKLVALAVVGVVSVVVGLIVLTKFPQIKVMMQESEQHNHIIIVGGGLAGLSAAIEATRHGATVTIIEKEKALGGNSAKATSGINGVGTEAQTKHGIEDSIEKFVSDTIASGDGLSDPNMVRILARNSGMAIDFLGTFNLNLTDVVQLGGHSAKRTHRFPPTADGKPVPVGFTIMSTLKKYIASEDMNDKVTVLTNSDFQGLVIEGDKSVGAKYKTQEGEVKEVRGIVILTAGGYANDHTQTSLLDKYVPQLSKYPTTNGPWATGDILKVLQENSASLVHMDRVQVHPTGFVDPKDPKFHTKFLAPEALRGVGALLLDGSGKRFVNELGRRDHVTAAIMDKCSTFHHEEGNPIVAAMLLTQGMIDKFSAPLAGFYIFKGLIQNVKTLAGVSALLEVPVDTLKQTLQQYAQDANQGKDQFGKTAFPTAIGETDNFYVAFVTPTLHYCMGGLQINTDTQVINTDKLPISGVFAAGEVTGGVHGNNRLGGNSLLECVVFGRLAGYHAAHYTYKQTGHGAL